MNNKSLAPLIISFATIILLTFIVINSHSFKSVPEENELEIKSNLSLSSKPKKKISPIQKTEKNLSLNYSLEASNLIEKAQKTLVKDNIVEAEDLLKTAIVLEPNNKIALDLLGGLYFKIGKYEEAEYFFKTLASLDKFKNSSSLNKLASAVAKRGKLKEAIELCLMAQQIDPNFAEAYINAAAIFAKMGDNQNSIKNMQKAYNLIGSGILFYCMDPVFDSLRTSPEFTEIISKAQKQKEADEITKN
ncbi:MAG TPA: hypothetical protein P5105_04575 [Victivallales bacterium]|nr:hypothetical protein [Victivallales bacterium]HPO89680.1 hypothetical protein [Victivallales bacterium]HRR06537.1 hypothetical protein [Victivallales bacterium]HRR27952.1 hypothetical protein [Victivallales bacterium]HRU00608.1 hypothetical protein [Victivallales bacterium]